MNIGRSRKNERTASAWLQSGETAVSQVLSRIVHLAEIRDVKILETNTEDIVREIYKTSGDGNASLHPPVSDKTAAGGNPEQGEKEAVKQGGGVS